MPALRNAKYERFAQLISEGKTGVDAYLESGRAVSRKVAGVNGANLRKRPEVKARIEELSQERAELSAGTAAAVDALTRELALVLVDVRMTETERAERLTWLLRRGRRAIPQQENPSPSLTMATGD